MNPHQFLSLKAIAKMQHDLASLGLDEVYFLQLHLVHLLLESSRLDFEMIASFFLVSKSRSLLYGEFALGNFFYIHRCQLSDIPLESFSKLLCPYNPECIHGPLLYCSLS